MSEAKSQSNHQAIKIAIVAGEMSGDILASGLIQALKKIYIQATFIGIAGPLMEKEGCRSLFPMERLSVMGFSWQLIRRIKELKAIQTKLVEAFIEEKVDIFIGVDASEFNLRLATVLKQKGITTVQYKAPTIWAWRESRAHKIKKACDLVLALFPFEVDFYKKYDVKVRFVGHPTADKVAEHIDQQKAKAHLRLAANKKILALLPGSRSEEITRLAPLYLNIMKALSEKIEDLVFVVPAVNKKAKQLIQQTWQGDFYKKAISTQNLKMVEGQSDTVMAASDVILLASGTAALEAMFYKKPTLVVYKMNAVVYFVISKMVNIKYVALPNILANKELMPEYLQSKASVKNILPALLEYLSSESKAKSVSKEFHHLHMSLKQDASATAAKAISQLLEKNKSKTKHLSHL